MKPFVQISFPSGHVYEVPTQVIADDRTSYYAMREPERTREQHAAETAMFFESEFELFDWAKNNMNWSDLQKHARLCAFNPPDFQGAWDDAVLSTVTEQVKTDVVALGEAALTAPIEMLMAQAFSEDSYCTVAAFKQSNGAVTSAIAAFIGEPDIVEAYIATLVQFDNFMASQRAAAQAAAAASKNTH